MKPRSFTYTPIAPSTGKGPVTSKLENRNRIKFNRKAQKQSLFSRGRWQLFVMAALLAGLVYLCLIIVDKAL